MRAISYILQLFGNLINQLINESLGRDIEELSLLKTSLFVDIVQIEVDLPPSYPIFDKFIFDKVLIMLTSLPPLEFLTKIMKF